MVPSLRLSRPARRRSSPAFGAVAAFATMPSPGLMDRGAHPRPVSHSFGHWWRGSDSNRRPPAYETGKLPTAPPRYTDKSPRGPVSRGGAPFISLSLSLPRGLATRVRAGSHQQSPKCDRGAHEARREREEEATARNNEGRGFGQGAGQGNPAARRAVGGRHRKARQTRMLNHWRASTIARTSRIGRSVSAVAKTSAMPTHAPT